MHPAHHIVGSSERIIVFAHIVPVPFLGIGEDGVGLGDEFEFLFVAALWRGSE
jgi:hypothetical protein